MSKNWVRTGTVAAVLAVPALAVAFLGSSLTAGLSIPSLQLAETRDFNRAGQTIAVTTEKKDAPEQVEIYLGDWQNTVRTAPTPRV
ncbi:MAG: hypothetical protein ACJ8C4_03845 [Gemmataceae bacterium]